MMTRAEENLMTLLEQQEKWEMGRGEQIAHKEYPLTIRRTDYRGLVVASEAGVAEFKASKLCGPIRDLFDEIYTRLLAEHRKTSKDRCLLSLERFAEDATK